MCAAHVTVTIRNPAEPSRCWEGLFLVDTGATEVDPVNQQLKKLPALRLKRATR